MKSQSLVETESKHGDSTLQMPDNLHSQRWRPMPTSLDIVVKLQTGRITSGGTDSGAADRLIEDGFAIANVTVMKITPSCLTFYIRLWRHATEEEKQLHRTGSIADESFAPAM